MNVDMTTPLGWGPNTTARPVVFPATFPDGASCQVFLLGFGYLDLDTPPMVKEAFARACEQLGDIPPPGAHPSDAFGPNPMPHGVPRRVPGGRGWGTEAVDKCRALALTDAGRASLLRLRKVWQTIATDDGGPVGALAVFCQYVLQADGVPNQSIRGALGDLLTAAAVAYLL